MGDNLLLTVNMEIPDVLVGPLTLVKGVLEQSLDLKPFTYFTVRHIVNSAIFFILFKD